MATAIIVQIGTGERASLDPDTGHWQSPQKPLERLLNALYAIENLECESPVRTLATCVIRDFGGMVIEET